MEWALLLLAFVTAFVLRLYRLDQVPPGLYRDEALNGLDALKVLQGEHAIFFAANNGREPLYIYLTAAAVALFGQTAFAIRISAGIIGSLTTFPVYMLGKSWFGRRTGLFAAWVWAITLWPVHLSRLGLRVILLAPLLTLAFWLGTKAYRRGGKSVWFLAGLLYGLTFYTYLAARFTPILLGIFLIVVFFSGQRHRLWPGGAWFVLGMFLVLLPLLGTIAQEPSLILGRTGQVSVLHPDVNKGDLWGTLWRHIGAGLGMFIWRGDTILRHNPTGRPVFDVLLLVPFLLGLFWCLRHWRKLPAMTLLIWVVVMLGPTILAADTPHFLRAAGVLPAVVYFPAIGLERIWLWNRLPRIGRTFVVGGLLCGSLLITIRDYASYASDPRVANAFESVATDMAQKLNGELEQTRIFVDRRLWTEWPSIRFLTTDTADLELYSSPADLPVKIKLPAVFYVWPYESLDYIPEILAAPALISTSGSDIVYAELDDAAYQLYDQYRAEEVSPLMMNPEAEFEGGLILQHGQVEQLDDDRLQVDVYWQANLDIEEELVVFVHVMGSDGLVGQHDMPPAEGRWQIDWWRPGQVVLDRHIVPLTEPYDAAQHQILVGLYRAANGERLPVFDASTKEPFGTAWQLIYE